jgi:hypothetical protein
MGPPGESGQLPARAADLAVLIGDVDPGQRPRGPWWATYGSVMGHSVRAVVIPAGLKSLVESGS